MPSFGEGLGGVIGAGMAADHLDQAKNDVQVIGSSFSNAVQPYNSFGQSFLPGATDTIGELKTKAGDTKGYDEFMAGYSESPGAKYVKDQALEAQNESAAAHGGLLSGTNQRALATIGEGISSTFANQAYDQYLKGDSQQFGQLESALGGMFKAIGVGTTATGQKAGVDAAQMGATANIAKSEAENDRAKGTGMGSMFGGVASMAAAF